MRLITAFRKNKNMAQLITSSKLKPQRAPPPMIRREPTDIAHTTDINTPHITDSSTHGNHPQIHPTTARNHLREKHPPPKGRIHTNTPMAQWDNMNLDNLLALMDPPPNNPTITEWDTLNLENLTALMME